MDAFTHVLGRYARQSPDITALIACVVAGGTNMRIVGIARMGQISDIGSQTLTFISDNYDKVRTTLTGFNPPSSYGDAILRTVRKIREAEIIRE